MQNNSPLTPALAEEIRASKAAGLSIKSLSEKFRRSTNTIRCVLKGDESKLAGRQQCVSTWTDEMDQVARSMRWEGHSWSQIGVVLKRHDSGVANRGKEKGWCINPILIKPKKTNEPKKKLALEDALMRANLERQTPEGRFRSSMVNSYNQASPAGEFWDLIAIKGLNSDAWPGVTTHG